MSGRDGQDILARGIRLMSKEEMELKRKIDATYFYFTFLPISIGSTLAVKYFIHKGTIKPKRPGFVYGGVLLLTYLSSKIMAFQEISRQMVEKFPNGVFSQTRYMNRDQMREYIQMKELEQARAKLEAAGMGVTDRNMVDPHQSGQDFGTTLDAQSKQPQEPAQSMNTSGRKTYADLRREQSQPDYRQLPQPGNFQQPSGRISPDSVQPQNILEDPPSKLRKRRENKYGDEME